MGDLPSVPARSGEYSHLPRLRFVPAGHRIEAEQVNDGDWQPPMELVGNVDNEGADIISSWPAITWRVLCAPGILIVSVGRIQQGKPTHADPDSCSVSMPDSTSRFDVEKGGWTHHPWPSLD